MCKEVTVRGCWGYNIAGEHDSVREILRQRRFPLEPLITHQINLDEASEMIWAMARQRAHYCKVMIDLL